MSINIRDIKNTLSEFTFNLGNLCKSNKINKYSFYKPVTSPKLTQLTTQDYFDLDDGFNLWTFSNPFDMLHELQSNNSLLWTYDEREAPFRMSDFWSYEHYAQPLFEFEFVGNNSGTFGETLRFQTSTDIQGVVNNWATPRTLSSTGDLILLVFDRSKQYDASGMGTVGIYKVCQFMNYDGGDIRFTIPSSSAMQTGDYTLVPCISTATYRLNDGEYYYYNSNTETWAGLWFAFPSYAKLNFAITQTSPSHLDFFSLFNVDQFYAVDFTYNPSNYELSLISFNNYIEYMPYNSTRQFSVTVEYYYTNCAQPVLLGQAYRTFNTDNILEQININYRDTITTITHARLEDDIISIEQRVSITSLGETQQKTYSRTLEKS